MAKMGKYCKAYLLSQLREYKNWEETNENARVDENKEGDESNTPRELRDDSILYIQENYIVTDGIFLDENIIFDKVSDEWKSYCENELNFSIPDYVHEMASENKPSEIEETQDVADTDEMEEPKDVAETAEM
jgi:hypothetical protein